MKTLIASTLLLTALATNAYAADTYTFTTAGKTTTTVTAVGPAGPVFGGTSTFENQLVDSSGKKSTAKGTCAAWSAEPGSALAVHGVCNSEGTDGNANVFFSCSAADAKTGVGNCWGFLMGTSGKYQGKTGTASWHSKQAADRKSSAGAGAIVWND